MWCYISENEVAEFHCRDRGKPGTSIIHICPLTWSKISVGFLLYTTSVTSSRIILCTCYESACERFYMLCADRSFNDTYWFIPGIVSRVKDIVTHMCCDFNDFEWVTLQWERSCESLLCMLHYSGQFVAWSYLFQGCVTLTAASTEWDYTSSLLGISWIKRAALISKLQWHLKCSVLFFAGSLKLYHTSWLVYR